MFKLFLACLLAISELVTVLAAPVHHLEPAAKPSIIPEWVPIFVLKWEIIIFAGIATCFFVHYYGPVRIFHIYVKWLLIRRPLETKNRENNIAPYIGGHLLVFMVHNRE